MNKEEVEEVRILMNKMDKNLMSFWGYERLESDEVEVRDYVNTNLEDYEFSRKLYNDKKGIILFLTQEIEDVFIVLEVKEDKNTIRFDYNGFGMSNHIYFPFFDNISTVDLLKVYIPRFEKSMIHLFQFVKMNNITEREFMLDYLQIKEYDK